MRGRRGTCALNRKTICAPSYIPPSSIFLASPFPPSTFPPSSILLPRLPFLHLSFLFGKITKTKSGMPLLVCRCLHAQRRSEHGHSILQTDVPDWEEIHGEPSKRRIFATPLQRSYLASCCLSEWSRVRPPGCPYASCRSTRCGMMCSLQGQTS